MECWASRIASILERAPTRALPFSRLLTNLAEEGVSVLGREEWILQRMMETGDSFKVVPDRLGPWVHWPDSTERGRGIRRPRHQGVRGDPWIMARKCRAPELGSRGRWAGRIRETLHAWGEDMDDGSQVAVARWIGANGEAERALQEWFNPGKDRG